MRARRSPWGSRPNSGRMVKIFPPTAKIPNVPKPPMMNVRLFIIRPIPNGR